MGKIDDSRPCSGKYKRTLKKFYRTRRKKLSSAKKKNIITMIELYQKDPAIH